MFKKKQPYSEWESNTKDLDVTLSRDTLNSLLIVRRFDNSSFAQYVHKDRFFFFFFLYNGIGVS